jgi:hypothetical protein
LWWGGRTEKGGEDSNTLYVHGMNRKRNTDQMKKRIPRPIQALNCLIHKDKKKPKD